MGLQAAQTSQREIKRERLAVKQRENEREKKMTENEKREGEGDREPDRDMEVDSEKKTNKQGDKAKRARERKGEGHRKCSCGNGVCHLVIAAGCCRGSGRQMDHEYCLDTLQPDSPHLISSPLRSLRKPVVLTFKG